MSSSIQPGGQFMRRMPVGGTTNLAYCIRAHIVRDDNGDLTTTPCGQLAANGTDLCLEHADPGTGDSTYHGAYERTFETPRLDDQPFVVIPARPYSLPELEPAPPTQRGWLGRAIGWVLR